MYALPVPQPFGAPPPPHFRCADGYHRDEHGRCVPNAPTCRNNGDGTTTCCTTTINVPTDNGGGDAAQRAHNLPVSPMVGASWSLGAVAPPNHPQCARPGWVYDPRMADCVPAGSVRCQGEPASGQQCCAPTAGNIIRCCDQVIGGMPRCYNLPGPEGGGGGEGDGGREAGGGEPESVEPPGHGARPALGAPAAFGAAAPATTVVGAGFNCRPTYSTASGSLTLTCEPQRGPRGEMPEYPHPGSSAFCAKPLHFGIPPPHDQPGYSLWCDFRP